jgi:pyruvate,water dikinase
MRVDLAALVAAVRHGSALDPAPAALAGPPLPARFRMSSTGTPVPVAGGRSAGTAAGGGRVRGVVHHGPTPPPGSILVVDALDPRLAAVLPGLGGLVATTGSPLSHLAILAREHGVATVVGVADATDRFPVGAEVLVDGATGEVELIDLTAPEVLP